MHRKASVNKKSISLPKLEEFDNFIKEARKEAKRAGLKKSDITNAIEKVRSKV